MSSSRRMEPAFKTDASLLYDSDRFFLKELGKDIQQEWTSRFNTFLTTAMIYDRCSYPGKVGTIGMSSCSRGVCCKPGYRVGGDRPKNFVIKPRGMMISALLEPQSPS